LNWAREIIPGDAHCKLAMFEDAIALAEFQRILKDHGATISALSCHGNALHPDKARAQHDHEVSRRTILLAEKLGTSVGGRFFPDVPAIRRMPRLRTG